MLQPMKMYRNKSFKILEGLLDEKRQHNNKETRRVVYFRASNHKNLATPTFFCFEQ